MQAQIVIYGELVWNIRWLSHSIIFWGQSWTSLDYWRIFEDSVRVEVLFGWTPDSRICDSAGPNGMSLSTRIESAPLLWASDASKNSMFINSSLNIYRYNSVRVFPCVPGECKHPCGKIRFSPLDVLSNLPTSQRCAYSVFRFMSNNKQVRFITHYRCYLCGFYIRIFIIPIRLNHHLNRPRITGRQ